MLTAKDINNKRFEQVKMGYKPEEVDDFLRDIAVQLSQMIKDRDETEKKIEVLVESVRNYKKDEDILKDAILSAQRQGRDVIDNANREAEKILSQANARAGDIIGDTRVQLEREKHNLVAMQQKVADFKSNLLNMYKQHLELITAIPDDDEEEQPAPVQQPTEEKPIEQAQPQAAATEDMDATRVMDNSFKPNKSAFSFDTKPAQENKFSNLKFGQNK